MLPLSPFDSLPEWLPVVGATVPNVAIGIALLVFRKRILRLAKNLFPYVSEFWLSRGILAGGLFLIVVASFLLVTGLRWFA